MHLGALRRAVVSTVDVVVTFVVVLAAAWAAGIGTGVADRAAAGQATPWSVHVGGASGTLARGGDTTLPFTVANRSASAQRLHAVSAQLHVGDVGCGSQWFNVVPSAPTAVVAPGGTVAGAVSLMLARGAPSACDNLDLAVDVTVT